MANLPNKTPFHRACVVSLRQPKVILLDAKQRRRRRKMCVASTRPSLMPLVGLGTIELPLPLLSVSILWPCSTYNSLKIFPAPPWISSFLVPPACFSTLFEDFLKPQFHIFRKLSQDPVQQAIPSAVTPMQLTLLSCPASTPVEREQDTSAL